MQTTTGMERRTSGGRRVPLDVLVEVGAADSGLPFEADARDLGLGGLSMRAAILPEVGSRMRCRFMLEDTDVEADAEVVWAHERDTHLAEFGLRFVTLDPRAEHAIRRLVVGETYVPPPPTALRPLREGPSPVLELRLDGVASPIVGRLVHQDDDGLLVEQELPFLRLRTAVRLDALGRRGSLQNVDVVVDGDVPRLLLDVALEPRCEQDGLGATTSSAAETTLRDTEPPRWILDEERWEARERADADAPRDGAVDASTSMAGSAHALPDVHVSPCDVEPRERAGGRIPLEGRDGRIDDVAPPVAPGAVALDALVRSSRRGARMLARWARRFGAFAVGLALRLAPRLRRALVALGRGLGVGARRGLDAMRARLRSAPPARLRRTTSLPSGVDARSRDRATEDARAGLRARHLVLTALASALCVLGLAHALGTSSTRAPAQVRDRDDGSEPRAATPPAERTQDPAVPASASPAAPLATEPTVLRPPGGSASPTALSHDVARAGGALRAQHPAQHLSASSASALATPRPSVPHTTVPSLGAVEPGPIPAPTFPSIRDAVRPPPPGTIPPGSPYAEVAPSGESPSALVQTFGARRVPGGRAYLLRTSRPVTGLRGRDTEDGFVVEIVGALALDRAAPIAASHGRVAQASVLNHGDRAELVVRFEPGRPRPLYQVAVRGPGVEVTIQE
ncbi:MAG: PilZ domain-containing protein [Myxococcota bacterium]|nr:PilZ domain-containing protein [Myxococcota bacterium]MDW8362462.1 PilZ domain-containing protein [Myxococcales bacterium]